MADTTTHAVPLLRLLRFAVGDILRDLEQQLAGRGWDDVRPGWVFTVGRLDIGPATINDLAEHLGVSKQAASKTVEAMDARGLVRLVRFEGDGRKRVVELTPEGQRFRADVHEGLARIESSWATKIGDDGVRSIRDHLESVLTTGPGRDDAHPPPAPVA